MMAMGAQLDLVPAAAVKGPTATQTKDKRAFIGTPLTELRRSKDEFKAASQQEAAE